MGNMLTYVEQYRDMDFSQMPFGEVDSLVLSQISYYNYSKSPFVRKEFSIPVSVYLQNSVTEKLLNHTLTTKEDKVLIEVLKPGGRHGNLRASNYVDIVDEKNATQFSAILFELGNEEYYIAFRGTDNTVTGWKEDMNISYLEEIPAQKAALSYAIEMFGEFSGNFYIGGHSKGGNLAVYAAMNLPEPYKARLLDVYNFDGPGFREDIYESKEYRSIRSSIRKYIPESSMIGVVWEKDDNYTVVQSEARGVMQHDPFNWKVDENRFLTLEECDGFSRYWKRILEQWIEEFSFEERAKLIDTIFEIIFETGISQFYQLEEETFQKIRLMIEGMSNLNEKERRFVRSAIWQFFLISVKEIPQAVREQWTEE